MVDYTDEHDEDRFFLASMILFHFIVEVYDVVYGSVDNAEGEVKHLDKHWDFVRVDLWIGLQVPQLPVNP